jgi:hypothetical protein
MATNQSEPLPLAQSPLEAAARESSLVPLPSSPSTQPQSPSPSLAIPHVRQCKVWDCGLACAEMLLRAAGIQSGVSFSDLSSVIEEQSVWTIDVALALAVRGIPPAYYTTVPGVNPDHRQLAFYSSGMDRDEVRVPLVYAEAKRRGVVVNEVRLVGVEGG